jgi:hypothetical protein
MQIPPCLPPACHRVRDLLYVLAMFAMFGRGQPAALPNL